MLNVCDTSFFRDSKYRSQNLVVLCPVCFQPIDIGEWKDYGMHLRCTECCNAGKSEYGSSNENKRELILSQ